MFAWFRRSLVSRLLVALTLLGLGCSKKAQVDVSTAEEKPTPVQTTSMQTPEVNPEPQIKAAAVAPKAAPEIQRDRLHQSFTTATLGPDSPPTDTMPPVDQTLTGKSAPRLYEQVAQAWDSVRFTSADGKKIDYSAEIITSHGTIRIALLPDIAPNHARNFIVLARLGYYDGLHFDRIHKEKGDFGEMDCIEGGCPLGTGSMGTGSIGYWLKDEFTPEDKLCHTEGVIGACRAPEADTAATKFYINLNTAKFRDGQYSLFARVVEGLDVARTMSKQAVINDPLDGGRARPQTPIIIEKVIVHEVTAEVSKK